MRADKKEVIVMIQFAQEYICGALVMKEKRLFVYKVGSNTKYIIVNCPRRIVSAMWIGNAIQIGMDDGNSRIYYAQNKFKNLR